MDLQAFIARHGLPDAFSATVERFYMPLARWLNARIDGRSSRALVVGINGAQGTGKSTLARLLVEYLASDFGRRVTDLSIDDLYLTRSERKKLARTVHPLLITRGVPGTHDVDLGVRTIEALATLGCGKRLAVPKFDKGIDDRKPMDEWPVVNGPIELVIFEGWCVGAQPGSIEELSEPINELEATRDQEGKWRRFVDAQLAAGYAALFARVDVLVFLKAPDFGAITRWRLEQEMKLGESTGGKGTRIMDETGIADFIQHFERITRRNLEQVPMRADVVIDLAHDHSAVSARYRR